MVRIGFVAFGRPNWRLPSHGIPTRETGRDVSVGRVDAQVVADAIGRSGRFAPRTSSGRTGAGPVMELRPALPHSVRRRARRKRRRVQVQSGRRVVERRSGVVRAQGSRDAGARDGSHVDRRERQSRCRT